MVCFLQRGNMECDHIAFAEQGLTVDIYGILPDSFIFIRIAGEDPAAETAQIADHVFADAACADHAYGHSADLPSEASRQGIIHGVRTSHDHLHLAKRHQDQHDCVIRNTSRRV